MDNQNTTDKKVDDNTDSPRYDPHIIPAETAARQKREGNAFMTTPSEANDSTAATDDQTGGGSLHTTDGYTVDKEGLLNNYAIEPEMYINEPGDLRAEEEARKAERAAELNSLQGDEEGKLTMEGDTRGKGPGIL